MSHPGKGWKLALLMMAALGLVASAGCPPVDGVNQAPTANAGLDQSVAPGAAVSLAGSGTDPDGDTLTFAWQQTAGTAVTLTNANAATATFTAPATAGTLTFQLTVSDGIASDTDSVDVVVTTTPAPPATTPQLFVANFGASGVVSYLNPETVNGNIAPNTNLAGAQTQLQNPADVVVTASGVLAVANFNGRSITAYNGATTANGNFPPDRNIQGAATGLGTVAGEGPLTLAIDRVNDLLFVGKIGGIPGILVYANASTATGNLAPTRTITNAALTTPFGINLDNNGNLYIANNATATVLVYANAANLNGNIPPTRTITGNPAFTGLFDVFVDSADRMYVVNQAGPPRINVFNNASTLNGNVAPNFTLNVTGAAQLTAIAVDAGGRGYLVDPALNRVYSYDGIATLNGTLPPTRTIAGALTQFATPIRLFLLE